MPGLLQALPFELHTRENGDSALRETWGKPHSKKCGGSWLALLSRDLVGGDRVSDELEEGGLKPGLYKGEEGILAALGPATHPGCKTTNDRGSSLELG